MQELTLEAMRAWRAFLEAHSRVTGLLAAELEDGAGLQLGWYDVLVQLSEAQGNRLRMTDLANAVLLSKSGLTRLVDRMCATGLVNRVPDPDDRRGTFVELTAAGDQRLREAAPLHLRGITDHFAAHLTDDELAAVTHAMRKLLAGLAAEKADGAQQGA